MGFSWPGMEWTPTTLERLTAALQGLFVITETCVLHPPDRVVAFKGYLQMDPESALEILRSRFEALGYTPLLRRDGQTDQVIAQAGVPRPSRPQPWVNLVLFLATVITTIWAGALYGSEGTLDLRQGIAFATALLLILSVHEMGHYVAARLHHSEVTLPYFIPVPPLIGMLGTFGAFIQIRSPMRNRKALFDISVAGPLAGLAVALPVLIYGLMTSPVVPLRGVVALEGNSILYWSLKALIFGRPLPGDGYDVQLNVLAWAGWIGLLVTGFNLLPLGQLDGGHIMYAMLGRTAWRVSEISVFALLALGLRWPGWFLWAFMPMLTGLRHPPPLNDITPLDPIRQAIGWLTWVLFLLIFVPVPFSLVEFP
ncbi:MAG: site-2 protease family protein [Anaerolineae bacterium]|nr:site-2 protease family protein [Thermoflexus sp.]MDW8065512.1 site-2 protease family protein [Anaerolineae bacterium]